MPVSVEIQDEEGRRQGDAWWHVRSAELFADDHPGTACLRFIHPYGDTTFNQSQLRVLLGELRQFRDRVKEPDVIEILDALVRFLEPAAGEIHTYVKFIGDEQRHHWWLRHCCS